MLLHVFVGLLDLQTRITEKNWVGRDLPRLFGPASLSELGNFYTRLGCSGPCPVETWMPLRMEVAQPFWAACSSVWPLPWWNSVPCLNWCLVLSLFFLQEASGFLFHKATHWTAEDFSTLSGSLGLSSQIPNHLHSPLLDLLQDVHGLMALGSPKLGMLLQLWSQKC